MMPRTGLFALFAAFLLAALLVFLPLRAISAVTGTGRDAAVFGTVWNGHIQGLAVGPRRLGEIGVAMRLDGFLSGRADFDWSIDDPSLRGQGRASTGAGGYRIVDAHAVMTPASFVLLPGGLLSPQDAASVTIDRIVWQDGACLSASGRVRSDALFAMGQRLGADLPALDGVLECREGALAVLLSGESPDATVSADIRWTPGRVTGQARIETGSHEIAAVLEASGFVLEDSVWSLQISGS